MSSPSNPPRSNNTHPTIRLDHLSEEDEISRDIGADFHSSGKFGFTWPGDQNRQKNADLFDSTPRQDSFHDPLSVNVISTLEESYSLRATDLNQEGIGAPGPSDTSRSSSHTGAPLPRLSRAFSMPLTSQIGHWQHPSRSPYSENPAEIPRDEVSSQTEQHFQELALELADSVQIAIQTLLQLSPPHLFDPAKEQYSACAVQIPTPSMCALLTSLKNINYISANMRLLGYPPCGDAMGLGAKLGQDSMAKDEFDIGEVLQSVGDSLGGVASEFEVDLVLHHGDVLKHVGLRGDECGISYALSHVIHQVLLTARPGDSIEIGLHTSGKPTSAGSSDHPSDSTSYSTTSSASGDSPTRTEEGPVICTFDIAHKYTSLSANGILSDDSFSDPQYLEVGPKMQSPQPTETRSEPQFDSLILRRLLKLVGGTLRTSLQPKVFQRGRRCELSVILERGPPLSVLDERTLSDEETYRHTFSDIRLAREPSIDELTGFVETLRGKKVAFHASSHGSFAHHLTRYLTAWGMDISHVPTDCLDEEKDLVEGSSNSCAQSQYGLAASPGIGAGISNGDTVPPIADSTSDGPSESKPTSSEPDLSLIIIDDDVQGLRRRLLQHRAESMPNLQPHSRKRPSLAAHHRPRSSPSVRSALLTVGSPPSQQQPSPLSTFTPVPIVHFTSLANYKLVKDVIQGMIFDHASLLLIPEVIVIPKPAGPRRMLTALHTAIRKPYVDPFFTPIATSPMSPGGTIPPFLSGRKPTSVSTPPSSLRSGTERPPRAGSDSAATMAPQSPHLIPEGLEYFSEASVKTLGGNAASGLVIQSPDGRPAGIFFQPQSRMPSSRTELTMTAMERERTAFRPASQRISRRNISRKTGVDNGGATEMSKATTPRHRSPSAKPLLDVAALSRLSISSAASPSLDRSGYGQVTDLQSSFRGKGRSRCTTVEQEESRVLTSAAWREATQNLAKPPQNPKTSLDFTPVSAVSSSTTQSPVTDSTPLSPTRLPCNPGLAAAPTSRSATSPTSLESKKSVARRATQGPRSPVVSTSMKKSKTVGNNIVPPISVLIVEDNAINQTILSTFMRRNKIKYEVAWNGREAVEKWRNGNFHLILMDIQMPVMDGIEATKEIRRLEKAESVGHFPLSPGDNSKRLAETPDSRPSSAASTPFRSQVIIVALTASSLQSDRVAALAAGCNDFLTKPVTNTWLNDKIIEWGSIKALQMWAELRPEMAKNISRDQAVQAQVVANKLHVPLGSARGSPLKDAHMPLPIDSESRAGEEAPDRNRLYRNTSSTGAKATRRHSNGSLSSDSSIERSPMSSDDDFAQDPITEPPAVIETPVRSTVELPPLENEPAQVTSEEALLHYLEDSKQSSQLPPPTLLGQRAISSATSATSITAVLHDVPGVSDTKTDAVAVAKYALENPPPADDDTAGH